MNSKLITIIIVDALHKSGLDIDINTAHEYLNSIPSGMKATIEDYEKWKGTQK